MPSNELPTWDQLRAKAHYSDRQVVLFHADCLDVLPTLPDNSVDAVVTDPPYGLEFMGKEWDRFAGKVSDRDFKGFVLSQQRTRNVKCPDCGKWAYDHPGRLCECGGIRRAQGNNFQQWCQLWAAECLRVLKPGGHGVFFGGTRTFHRLACALEDAGFEIRDTIAWLYGSGYAKSWNFRTMYTGEWCECDGQPAGELEAVPGPHEPLDDGALRHGAICPRCGGLDQVYKGFGSGIKPAHEPVTVARKPLAGSIASNTEQYGTGALNIDACRIAATDKAKFPVGYSRGMGEATYSQDDYTRAMGRTEDANPADRWPANVALDETSAGVLDRMSGETVSNVRQPTGRDTRGIPNGNTPVTRFHDTEERGQFDSGGASRFFYTAKAGSDERITHNGVAHPTVKPLSLMRWLVRLVTPPGGTILEPFAGSGTAVEAAILEGFRCIAIEREPDYLPLITQRLNRRRDPIAYLTTAGEDLGLFGDST